MNVIPKCTDRNCKYCNGTGVIKFSNPTSMAESYYNCWGNGTMSEVIEESKQNAIAQNEVRLSEGKPFYDINKVCAPVEENKELSELKSKTIAMGEEALKLNSQIGNFGAPENKESGEELRDTPDHLGDFILSKRDVVPAYGVNGNYYHYADVCTLLKEHTNRKLEEIMELVEKDTREYITTDGFRFAGISRTEVERILEKFGYKVKAPF